MLGRAKRGAADIANLTPLQTPSRQKLPSQNNSQRSDSQIRSDAQNRSDVERSDAESRSKSPTPTSHHSAAQDPRQFVETSTDDSVLLLKKELTDYLNNVKRAFPSKLQQRQERSHECGVCKYHHSELGLCVRWNWKSHNYDFIGDRDSGSDFLHGK